MTESMKYYESIRREYPETISKDQFYRIAHISKATALHLLQSGLVPCRDSGKKTRRYTIRTDDVIYYMIDRELHPEVYRAPDLWYQGRSGHYTSRITYARRNFNPEEPKVMNGDILFADYMEKWLDIIKSSVAVPTFASYSTTVKKIVAPYFREKEVTLKNLTAKDIQEFYLRELERVSASSVIHYHANIHKALKYAVKIDLIDVNPADKVERPKKDRYVGSFYDADEVNALFDAAKGSKLELPILFGAFYGLRRSEAIGLKWDAIDFDQNTITIRHTVTSCDLDGKRILVASDTTKTKSSMRTLPLVPFMRERLLALKEEQEDNRRLCGRSYIKDYIGYVCVNEIGDLIKPHYVTESFPKLLKANGLRHIRYHDLRHSCASLLLANGVPMKQIQEWLGHSDFSTTANIYAHLDYSSKLTSADAMLNGLGLVPN